MTYSMITAARRFARLFQLGCAIALDDKGIELGRCLYFETGASCPREMERSESR